MNPNDYLHHLASKVRALSGTQLLRHYFGGDTARMHAALRADKQRGLIEISTELVRERNEVKEPIAVVEAGKVRPDPEHIAYEARKRWSETVSPTLIVRGTAKLCSIAGGEPHKLASANIAHEVALADVFLTKRTKDPSFSWILVHAKPNGGALPDAFMASGCCELIGRYNGGTVAAKISIAGSINVELW